MRCVFHYNVVEISLVQVFAVFEQVGGLFHFLDLRRQVGIRNILKSASGKDSEIMLSISLGYHLPFLIPGGIALPFDRSSFVYIVILMQIHVLLLFLLL